VKVKEVVECINTFNNDCDYTENEVVKSFTDEEDRIISEYEVKMKGEYLFVDMN
jgi:hypothetical protein